MLLCILSLGCDFVEARDFGACFWFCSGSRVQTRFVETHFWVSESGIFGFLNLWNFVNALGFGFWNFGFFWMGEFGNFGFWNLIFFFCEHLFLLFLCVHGLFFIYLILFMFFLDLFDLLLYIISRFFKLLDIDKPILFLSHIFTTKSGPHYKIRTPTTKSGSWAIF